jgi:hypothetical protein
VPATAPASSILIDRHSTWRHAFGTNSAPTMSATISVAGTT